jgi:peptide/nickel transport system permease protein
MVRYLVTRLLVTIPVLIVVTFAVFGMLFLAPGDPTRLLIPPNEMANVSVERLDEMKEELGLNDPIPVQYANWLTNAVRGDLGESIRYHRPVGKMILAALPVTLEMGALAMFFSLIIAIPVGILSARRPNTPEDFVSTTFALLGVSTPNFWLAIMLILLFAVMLDLLPAAGFVRFTDDPVQNLRFMILPALTMSAELMALAMRMTRSSFLEVYQEEFVRTARAKGLGERAVLLRHAFRAAMIPIITVIGLQVGAVLSGAFIIEQIFAIPGIGKLGVDAIFKRDFPVVQGVTLFTALMFVTVNLAVDVLYSYIDPRITSPGTERS